MSNLHAVVYTDGGAEPPRGAGGSGVFGYTYEKAKELPVPTDDKWYPSSEGYYTVANIPKGAYWVQPIEFFKGIVSYPMAVTNNVAELGAAILAFDTIKERKWSSVWIRPDSQYVLTNYQDNLERWRQTGWQTVAGDPISNQPQWESMYQLGQELRAAGCNVNWRWVKGHSDDPGNIRADTLATQGKEFAKLARAMREIRFSEAPALSRETSVEIPDVNKMLSMPRWYFTNDESTCPLSPDNRFVYYGGSHGKDDELFAKPMSDSTFCVLWLEKPDPVMETLRQKQNLLNLDNFCEMVIGHLDTILTPRVYENIFVNGAQWIDPFPGTNDLMVNGEQLLTRELSKPRLALTAVERLMQAESLLKDHVNGTLRNVHSQDITGVIFDITVKKEKTTCKLKKDLTTASKTIEVSIEYTGVGDVVKSLPTRLVLGQDLPRRNTLAHLAARSPKVTLLSWSDNPNSFYFATIVEADKDISIWMGYPANYRVIPKE